MSAAAPCPPDAPVPLCVKHLQKAYLYVKDLIDAHEPQAPAGRPGRQLAPTVVYYIRFGDRIKIGTSADIWTRVKQVPCDRLLATEPGGFDVERERHVQFKKFRLNANSEVVPRLPRNQEACQRPATAVRRPG